jgi:hypothetical protein
VSCELNNKKQLPKPSVFLLYFNDFLYGPTTLGITIMSIINNQHNDFKCHRSYHNDNQLNDSQHNELLTFKSKHIFF